MSKPEITAGAVRQMFADGTLSGHPVLQIIDIKRINSSASNPNTPPRFRLALSDGTHFQQAMIATQLNKVIADNNVQPNALIRLKEIICNDVQGKRIVIILNLDLEGALPYKVGQPVSIDSVGAAAAAAGSAPPNSNAPQQPHQQPPARQQPPMQQQPPQNNQFQTPGGFGAPSAFGARPDTQSTTSFGGPGATGGGGGGGFGAPRANGGWQSNAAPNPFSRPGGPGGSSGIVSKMPNGGGGGGGDNGLFRPIATINPYQNGWTIRGRCTFKGDVRTFTNSRGEGKVTSFELTDDSGSIRITGFNQMADTIETTVQPNKLFRVSRGYLKQANEKYNRSTSAFEMTLDPNAMLEEAEDDGTVSKIAYKFVKIANLESVPVKGNCDVVGVITAVGQLSDIVIRSTGESVKRRSVTLTDDSNASVEITLWRRQAESLVSEEAASTNPVLAVRNALRGDFGGVSLNVSRMTTLELNPVNVDEGHKLRAWFDAGGLNAAAVQSVTSTMGGGGGGKIMGPRKTLDEAREEDVDPVVAMGNEVQATFNTRVQLLHINTKNDIFYPSDPETKRKVVSQGDGTYLSESSGRSFDESQVQWRYLISGKVADSSSSHWVTGFDEFGTAVFGRQANELRKLQETDRGMFDHLVDDVLARPLLVRVQAKERTWNDTKQIRYTASRVEMMDFASETEALIKEIEAYNIS